MAKKSKSIFGVIADAKKKKAAAEKKIDKMFGDDKKSAPGYGITKHYKLTQFAPEYMDSRVKYAVDHGDNDNYCIINMSTNKIIGNIRTSANDWIEEHNYMTMTVSVDADGTAHLTPSLQG